MSILITGGAGFIGSHTAVEFLNAGYEIIVVDNYCNSSPKSIERVKEITGKDFKVYEVDMCDKDALEKVFQENPEIDSAIHFAGLKAVGESVQMPGLYYYNNLLSTLNCRMCSIDSDHIHSVMIQFADEVLAASVVGDGANYLGFLLFHILYIVNILSVLQNMP